jgi:hypothetical protein
VGETPTEVARRYLPLVEAVRYSGMSAASLRRLAAEGRLRFFRPAGKRVCLVDVHELDEVIRGEPSR